MKAAATKRKTSVTAAPGVIMKTHFPGSAEERLNYIATAAYYKAEARGFAPGEELDDWLEAEANFEVCREH